MENSGNKYAVKISSLPSVLNVTGTYKASGAGDILASGIAYNSGQVNPGDIFVAIRGFKADGHDFIGQAREKGALAAVVEDFREDIDLPQFRVNSSRYALSALAGYFYDHPSQKMKTIGITATKGKTTTVYMINDILLAYGLTTGLIGTVIVKIGDSIDRADLTTPESLDLQRYLARMVEKNVTHVAMEVSSSALELKRCGHVAFDIVALVNISRDHIDLHGSFERYVEIKSSLVTEAVPGTWAILNLDDPHSAALAAKTGAKVVTFSLEKDCADVCCRDLDLSTGRPGFTIDIRRPISGEGVDIKTLSFRVQLGIMGYQAVYNAAVAAVSGLLCGVPIENVRQGLENFKGVERRFEVIFEDGLTIIDDHSDTAENINVTLKTLQYMDYENLKLVYAIRGSRGLTVNRENAEAIARWVPELNLEEVVVTRSRSHVTEKDRVTEEEFNAFREVLDRSGVRAKYISELPEAVAHAFASVKKGDVVLLGGSQGMDYGARYALEEVSRMRPGLDRKKLFGPLGKRVAGSGPL